MKVGTVCRCQCGREYIYRGGRPNGRCPECYKKIRLERVKEVQRRMKSKRSGTGKSTVPQKRRAQNREVQRIPDAPAPPGRGKIPKKKMQELMQDPVFRLCHEIEIENRKRKKLGLRPLDYGEYVWKFGK